MSHAALSWRGGLCEHAVMDRPLHKLALLGLLLAGCGKSGAAPNPDGPPQLRAITAEQQQALAQHAAPSTWKDLDPAHPGTRLEDPRTGIVFRRIPKGTFTMGSMTSAFEVPPHEVELTRDYLLAETEVTAAQWQRFVEQHGGPLLELPKRSDAEPRTHLRFDEAVAFCTTYGYRLPTEAEWERAARGGLTDQDGPWRSQRTLADHSWFHTNSKSMVHPVATKLANPYGLYDMLGNVWEYCSDWFAPNYGDGARAVDPSGPASGPGRAMRGGSWFSVPGPPPSLRSAEEPDLTMRRNSFTGFRPARSLD